MPPPPVLPDGMGGMVGRRIQSCRIEGFLLGGARWILFKNTSWLLKKLS